jgi:hypothetical protein
MVRLSTRISRHLRRVARWVSSADCSIRHLASVSTPEVSDAFLSCLNSPTDSYDEEYLPRGVVILISIAIAAGIVFFLLLIGVLWAIFNRRDDQSQEEYVEQEGDDDSLHHRPSSLLEHINAATRNTIIGSPAGGVFAGAEKRGSPDPTDGTHGGEGEEEDGMGAGQAYNDPDGEGRVARARCEYLKYPGSGRKLTWSLTRFIYPIRRWRITA